MAIGFCCFKEDAVKEKHEAKEKERAELKAKIVHHAKPVPVKVISKRFAPQKLRLPLKIKNKFKKICLFIKNINPIFLRK